MNLWKKDPAIALWAHDRAVVSTAGGLGGIDEAGRGPLAGDVVAACVILNLENEPIHGLNDSKKLKAKERERLFPIIQEKALGFGIGSASPDEIDTLNILQATFLAMRRALAAMSIPPALILVDGNHPIPELATPQKTVIGGDALSASIAAASVLAKVTRDRRMVEMDKLYPDYGFAKHKGYGTEEHTDALRRLGLCPIHRLSFCGDYLSMTRMFPAMRP